MLLLTAYDGSVALTGFKERRLSAITLKIDGCHDAVRWNTEHETSLPKPL